MISVISLPAASEHSLVNAERRDKLARLRSFPHFRTRKANGTRAALTPTEMCVHLADPPELLLVARYISRISFRENSDDYQGSSSLAFPFSFSLRTSSRISCQRATHASAGATAVDVRLATGRENSPVGAATRSKELEVRTTSRRATCGSLPQGQQEGKTRGPRGALKGREKKSTTREKTVSCFWKSRTIRSRERKRKKEKKRDREIEG